MAAGLFTADLLQHLCETLGHEDAMSVLIKKLVLEQSLKYVENIGEIPAEQLEEWGVPLKLVSEIFEWLNEYDAQSNISGISAWLNYTVRPALAKSSVVGDVLLSTFRETVDREDWAARKLQSTWRSRKLRQQVRQDQVLNMFEIGPEDSKRLSTEDRDELRERRAKDKLRRFIRRWRLRRAERLAKFGLGGHECAMSSESTVGHSPLTGRAKKALSEVRRQLGIQGHDLVPDRLLEVSRGRVKECEVKDLLTECAAALGRREEDLADVAHRLVTLNWLEEADDLDLIADHHWVEWGVSKEVSGFVREHLEEKTGRGLAVAMDSACSPFAFLWGGWGGHTSDQPTSRRTGRRAVSFAAVSDD